MKTILADKLYIPIDQVDQRLLRKHYEHHLYKNEGVCRRCEGFRMRFSSMCAPCPNHEQINLWGKAEINHQDYAIVPSGDIPEVEKRLNTKLRIKDIRPDIKFKHSIKFTGKLRRGEIIEGHKSANQVQILNKFFKNSRKCAFGSGLLQAMPRVGKTVMALVAAIYLKRRTLILVHKIELARQFLAEVHRQTNVLVLEKQLNKRIAGIARKDSDYTDISDIVCSTYQSFISAKGKQRLNKLLRGKFSTVIVDECHKSNSLCFSQVVNNLDCRYKIGLTATVKRKDHKEFVAFDVIGPVQVVSKSRALIPQLNIVETGVHLNYEPKGYTKLMEVLANNEERNKLIVRKTFEILRSDPKRCILITCLRVDHCENLTKMINQQAWINNNKRQENWHQSRLAVAFHGKSRNREQIMHYVGKGQGTRVLVAMRSMVTEGNNVPVWTDLLFLQLYANPPQTSQLCPRICTPYLNKPQPMIYAFVDDVGLSYGCFGVSWRENFIKEKFIMDEPTRKRGWELVNRKRGFQ